MSVPSWCYVGAKVVCVDDRDHDPGIYHPGWRPPVKGKVYTVSFVSKDYGGRGTHVGLVGLPNARFGADAGFRLSRFRPLVSQADDLEAHFSQLLIVSTPQTVEA